MTHAMRLKQLALALSVAAGMAAAGTAQAIEITRTTDATELANALLAGSGLTGVTASLSGHSYPDEGFLSSGTYTNASTAGVVLSTGDVIEQWVGMNYVVPATDSQTALLNPISGGMPDYPDLFWDVTQLDITLPQGLSGVEVFVTFASYEYDTYMYNDVFGVFVDLPSPLPGPTCETIDYGDYEETICTLFDTSPYNIAFYNDEPINALHSDMEFCDDTEPYGVLTCGGPMRFALTGLDPAVAHTLTFIIADYMDDTVDSVAYISGLRAIPEPATVALLGLGLAGLATLRRRQT